MGFLSPKLHYRYSGCLLKHLDISRGAIKPTKGGNAMFIYLFISCWLNFAFPEGEISISVEMLEGRTSQQVYSLMLPDGSQLRLDMKDAQLNHQLRTAVGGSRWASKRPASRSDLRPWQRVSIRASRSRPEAAPSKRRTASKVGSKGATEAPDVASSSIDLEGQSYSYQVHELTVLPLSEDDYGQHEVQSQDGAIGNRSNQGSGFRKGDKPANQIGRYPKRRLLQASEVFSPYAIPKLPYAPSIIFALMSNCGGPPPAPLEDMYKLLFGISAESSSGSSSGNPNATATSFAGWSNACSYGQVTIDPNFVRLIEV